MARAGGSVRPCAPTGARKQHLVFHFRPDRKQLRKVHLISSLMIHPITSLRMVDVVVTTGAIRRAKLQSNRHHQQTWHPKYYTWISKHTGEGRSPVWRLMPAICDAVFHGIHQRLWSSDSIQIRPFAVLDSKLDMLVICCYNYRLRNIYYHRQHDLTYYQQSKLIQLLQAVDKYLTA